MVTRNCWTRDEMGTYELEVKEGVLYANTNIDEITRKRYFLLGLYEKGTEEDIFCVRNIPDSGEFDVLKGALEKVKSLANYRDEVVNIRGLPQRLRRGLIGLLDHIEKI